MQNDMVIRSAEPADVGSLHDLLVFYGNRQLLLPRSETDIRAHLGNFLVAECQGQITGCVALRDFGNGLYEIRSLAVVPAMTGKGLGSSLVVRAVERGISHAGSRIFALTHHPNIFFRLGFTQVDKHIFPEKIWADCSQCPKIDHCDEVAVLFEAGKNRLPDAGS